jgi:hypothetical protein
VELEVFAQVRRGAARWNSRIEGEGSLTRNEFQVVDTSRLDFFNPKGTRSYVV